MIQCSCVERLGRDPVRVEIRIREIEAKRDLFTRQIAQVFLVRPLHGRVELITFNRRGIAGHGGAVCVEHFDAEAFRRGEPLH